MKISEISHHSIRFLSILGLLLCVSILNYSLMQFVGTWFLPLTVVSIFVTGNCIANNSFIISVMIAGLCDDVLSNGFLGLYPSIYLAMDYILSTKLTKYRQSKMLIFSFFTIILAINVLTYKG